MRVVMSHTYLYIQDDHTFSTNIILEYCIAGNIYVVFVVEKKTQIFYP